MTPTGKSQPQALLESILPIETRNESEKYPSDPEPLPMPGSLVTPEKWPSVSAQAQYWADKEKTAEPKPPRKWSAARVKHCPFCGGDIERFLA